MNTAISDSRVGTQFIRYNDLLYPDNIICSGHKTESVNNLL